LKRVSVVGLGYVGLTFSACLASKGFEVYGVKVYEKKRRLIAEGRSPIYEDGLDDLLRKAGSNGLLKVTDDFREAIINSEITFP